jgi:hypothetical protein
VLLLQRRLQPLVQDQVSEPGSLDLGNSTFLHAYFNRLG